ncbi:hypothetical protein KEM60_00144 [Austwickia sp. TVS 96-490-7B]|nr:hypothetical protein [Austwickia sp. TVS 96-490-7B]
MYFGSDARLSRLPSRQSGHRIPEMMLPSYFRMFSCSPTGALMLSPDDAVRITSTMSASPCHRPECIPMRSGHRVSLVWFTVRVSGP